MGTSSRLAIFLAGARVFFLGMLGLLTLPFDTRVEAVTFTFRGFKENSVSLVSNSNWIFNTTTGCFYINPAEYTLDSIGSGRFLFPGAVQMIDPGSTTVKSFSTTFIYQLQIGSNLSPMGPGLAFIVVPDNKTLGALGDFMGLLTDETSETAKNYESDNHTLGVELDSYMNPEFNDINDNHIGINLANMTSAYSFKPVYILASSSADLYQQIWIDYFEADSRMDIYYANYKEGKPAKPQGSQSGLDLSLLKETMFTGFSSANKYGSSDVSYVCAWSFSNDGIPAPPIVIAQDALPGAPPPPAPVPPSSPPNGPVAAPSLPPPASIPSPPPVPTQSPLSSPPPPPASNPPPLRTPNPSPSNPPNPPPPSGVPPQGPSSEPPTLAKNGGKKKNRTGVYVGVPGAALLFVGLVGLFMIIQNIDYAKDFIAKILEELARFDVGVVVVTEAFFKAKWPMTELIAFVETQKKDTTGRIRILPLFYKLSPEQVRAHLDGNTWEGDWEEMSKGNRPLQVEKCREAVTWLCRQRGIPYDYNKRDHDNKYIEEICKRLDGMLRKERSFPATIWRAITSFSCSK